MKPVKILPLLMLGLILAACATETRDPAGDPYADPGTPPPARITDPTVAVAFSVGAPDSGNIIELNVAGFADLDSTGIGALSTDGFTVVEDGVVKGITVSEIGGGTRAGADIAFVFDTTSSMGTALAGVVDSISEFALHLDGSGLDVQLAAVTFGDAFDTHDGSDRPGTGSSLPPAFDSDPRPLFSLSTDTTAFLEFIQDQTPEGGANLPENAVGALWHSYQTLDWRAGAQCILIVITDVQAWQAPAPGESISEIFGDVTDPWIPPASADVIAELRGSCVVHVISPELLIHSELHVDMKDFTGSEGTGGVFHAWDRGELDLTGLPITGALTAGHVVRYRGTVDGSEHDIRLVFDDGSGRRGEHTSSSSY